MDKLLLISSSGGHFSELNKLNISDKYQTIKVTEKNQDTINKDNIDYYIKYGTRSNLIKYLFVFVFNTFLAFKIIYLNKPKIVISTGAHSCVPFFIVAKIFGKKTIYIESFAKVNSPSLTYKIANRFMDEVIVQHREMLKVYREAKYYGGLY